MSPTEPETPPPSVTHHVTMPSKVSGYTLLFAPHIPTHTGGAPRPVIPAPIWPANGQIPFFFSRGAATAAARSHMNHANSLLLSPTTQRPDWYTRQWPFSPDRPLTAQDYRVVPCEWSCTQTADPFHPPPHIPPRKRTPTLTSDEPTP